MNILAIDTALGACSAAVLVSDIVAAHEHRPMSRGHAEELAPMVQRVMNAAGLQFTGLECVAVTIGPGTFTGQRVGLAFARALGVGLKIPVMGATTLEAMAEHAMCEHPESRWAIVAADAKRGEVYLAAIARNGAALVAPQLISVSEVGAVVEAAVFGTDEAPVLAGTGSVLIGPQLNLSGLRPVQSHIHQPDAVHVARAALRLARPAKPLYLRQPDAKLPAGAA